MNKGQRHIKIREIITRNEIETQDELVDMLKQDGYVSILLQHVDQFILRFDFISCNDLSDFNMPLAFVHVSTSISRIIGRYYSFFLHSCTMCRESYNIKEQISLEIEVLT